MSKFEIIKREWSKELSYLTKLGPLSRIETGSIGPEEYASFLIETYHQAGANPQIQAFASMYLKDNPRDMIRLFYKHAISEIGHDLLALDDAKALGIEESKIVNSRPLPDTLCLTALPIYMIQFVNPLCYLGYLFHLEFLPTQEGFKYKNHFIANGVPENAFSFIDEHSKADIGHNKLMIKYIDNLIQSEKDLKDVVYAAKATCHQHMNMLDGAFNRRDKFWLD